MKPYNLRLKHIVARHRKMEIMKDFYYTSIKAAKEANPDFYQFRLVKGKY